jgi:hypothetical protein
MELASFVLDLFSAPRFAHADSVLAVEKRHK